MPPEIESPPKLSAGVSLWHKIFGAPAEQADKLAHQEQEHVSSPNVEIEETIEERERSWSAGDAGLDAVAPIDAEPIDVVAEADAIGESDESDPGKGRRQRPRRRRRGRDRRGGEARGDGEQVSRRSQRSKAGYDHRGNDDDFDDLGVERELDNDFAVGPPRDNGLDDENGPDESTSDELNGCAPEGRGNRRIPSWDEAIGMIVEANLQSRSQRRSSSHSSSISRGGRGRGGRRRRKPSSS